MASPNRYLTSWESFWSTTTGTPGEIFWDADPTHAAQQDLGLFRDYLDLKLPLIDLGCGNGTQTLFLGKHFTRVIGTEIAPAAVELAGKTNAAPNISYRLLDVLRPDDADVLHKEISICGRCCINCRPQTNRRRFELLSGSSERQGHCI